MAQFSKELLRGSLDIVVLRVLSEQGECYGYQLITAIEDASDHIFELGHGTVYPLLYRLEEHKLIASTVKLAPSGKERRYYHILPAGQKLLTMRIAEFAQFFRGMNNVLKTHA